MDNSDLLRSLESLLSPALEAPIEQPQEPVTQGSPAEEKSASRRLPFTLPQEDAAPDVTPTMRIPVIMPTANNAPAHDVPAAVLDALPLGIALLDGESRRLRQVNEQFMRMLRIERAPAEVTGQPLAALLTYLPAAEIEDALQTALRTNTPTSALLEDRVTASGEYVVYRRVTLSPFAEVEGQTRVVLLTLQDVTDQIRARQRLEEATRRTREHDRQVATRVAVASVILRGLSLVEMIAQIADEIGQALGDCCGIFLLDQQAYLWPWALSSRDPLQAVQLRTAYAQRPLRLGEGLIGRIARDGVSIARAIPPSGTAADIAPLPDPLGQVLGLVSVACVPLRDANETLGALLVFSSRRAVGGSDRTLSQADLGLLKELSGTIALSIQNERLRHAVQVSESQQHAAFELLSEGIALYDHRGHMRQMNSAARRLLAHPRQETTSSPATAQGRAATDTPRWLSLQHQPLLDNELPWVRATRATSDDAVVQETLTLAWSDGAERRLIVRAVAVRDAAGDVTGVVAHFRAEEHAEDPESPDGATTVLPLRKSAPPTAPLADALKEMLPTSSTADIGSLCARIARAHGANYRRRLEVHMPKHPVALAVPEHQVERILSALLDLAATSLPLKAPLAINVWLDSLDSLDSPGTASLRPLEAPGESSQADKPRFAAGRPRRIALRPPAATTTAALHVPAVVVHICGAQPVREEQRNELALSHTRSLASAVGGDAWAQHDEDVGSGYIVRIPLSPTPR